MARLTRFACQPRALRALGPCPYYLIARVIGFLAMYHDGVLRATYHDREALMGQNMPFLECYAVALLFLSFLDCYCIMSEHKTVCRLLVA